VSSTFITLSCPNCGGTLEIYDDIDRFACSFCGSETLIQRRGGTVALKKVETAIRRVQVGTDRTAAELAMPRLHVELQQWTRAEQSLLNHRVTVLKFTSGHGLWCLGMAMAIFAPLWVLAVEWATFWERHSPLLRVVLWVTATTLFSCGIWIWQQGRRRRKREKAKKAEEMLHVQEANANRVAEIRSQIARVRAQILENRQILDS